MLVCPHCFVTNPNNTDVCKSCGKSIMDIEIIEDTSAKEKKYIGIKVISFLFPLIGLVAYVTSVLCAVVSVVGVFVAQHGNTASSVTNSSVYVGDSDEWYVDVSVDVEVVTENETQLDLIDEETTTESFDVPSDKVSSVKIVNSPYKNSNEALIDLDTKITDKILEEQETDIRETDIDEFISLYQQELDYYVACEFISDGIIYRDITRDDQYTVYVVVNDTPAATSIKTIIKEEII